MIHTEDDLRALFDGAASPDLAPPSFEQLRRRAYRRRARQAGTALLGVAVLAAGTIGGVALSRGSAGRPKGPLSQVAAAVPGHRPAWVVNRQTVAGYRFDASSYLSGKTPCIWVSRYQNWCQGSRWPTTVADYKVLTSDNARVVDVVGRVPVNARRVTVNFAAAHVTVPAVRTPTTDSERFFSAALKVPPLTMTDQPLIGVVDADERAVAPVHPASADGSPASERTHVAGLPSNQIGFAFNSDGWDDIAYTAGGNPCVAVVESGRILNHGCARTPAPTGTTILITTHLARGLTEVLGVEPTWAGTEIVSRQSSSQPSAIAVSGFGNLRFWIQQGGHDGAAPYRMFTCHAGVNCTIVTPYRP